RHHPLYSRLPHCRGLSQESRSLNGDQIRVQTERESLKQREGILPVEKFSARTWHSPYPKLKRKDFDPI
ncbi:hypothetical protein LINPERHAP2_LOCUS3342, partial [Linum perenne]